MQAANRAKVEIQVFRVELETLGDLLNGLLEFHKRHADVLDLCRRQGLLLESPDRLALHEFADEFDEAEYQLDD